MSNFDNMYDFTKAKNSLNFKSNVMDKIAKLQETIDREKVLFVGLHDELEFYRKQRSAIIENVIKELKDADMKSEKPLGRYNNDDLMAELNRLIDDYPEKDTEFIEIAIVKIRRRTKSIEKVTRKLIECEKRIDEYIDRGIVIMPEADYSDEVVISLSEIRNRSKIGEKKVDQSEVQEVIEIPEKKEELDKVIGVHPASQELINKLNKLVQYKDGEDVVELDEQTTDDFTPTSENSSLAEDLDELNIASFLGGDSNSEYKEETPDKLESDNASEYVECTMGKMLSLQKMAEMVYQQEDNNGFRSELWTGVYNYGQNKEIIDNIADKYGVDVEEVISSPGYLEGETLAFPTELTAYKKVTQDSQPIRKSA